jgi:putative endonuclease
MNFYIYILYSPTFDKYYIGHSEDPWRRIGEHNSGKLHKFTSDYRPWELAATFEIGDNRGLAMKIEKFIKRQKSRTLIQKLIDPDFIPEGSLALLVRVPHVRD